MLTGTILAELAGLQHGENPLDHLDRIVLARNSLDKLLVREHSLDLGKGVGQALVPDLAGSLSQALGILGFTGLQLCSHLLHVIGQLDNDGTNLFLFPRELLVGSLTRLPESLRGGR